MRDALASLAHEIRKSQAALREKARAAREADTSLVMKTTKTKPLSLSVCAVDGGLFAHRLHGHDVVATRAVGVNFVYKDSALASFAYHPSKSPEPEIEIRSALDEHEANVFRSLIRLKSELGCALATIERYPSSLLLMDGSLWTVPSDRPAQDSPLAPLYRELVDLYKRLYSSCERNRTQLCGVVKDSRSRKLASSLGLDCSDTVLCSHLLDAGERTSVFPYFDDKQKEPEGFWERLKVFYIKPSEHDLPLRIEFLQPSTKEADENTLASLILSLSSISQNFAYPAILVEADMRAAMDPKEIERIQDSLRSLDIAPLRRNARPFR
ncbi:DNA double-strand break repair nuclease NurA [Candidatus Micrarchaeota archaeon]|nr:DNA double-strand break repair nuclease NurA [Candidatus Micrarchaeota archaeon]